MPTEPMEALGKLWPNTGRSFPKDGKLEIHILNPKWLDLVYWREDREVWVYVSTLPNN